ncbi:aminotransferase class I/II-fold pyridoxal phosphate-dependent enzyme [Streptomyces sp. NRRL F-5126]|uniref:aminotransferase class I/II-fold pyridoxal phosphate-dependent enzyme n=1 Tax=Streptomyces sp. NRRL F-5126 TaxID=1463857 RepID=UPI0004C7566A|nr:aminotransferase class I/II-fold pyridoxal phosphate-dependent enzyme [Streptomyces sp. NRRL F-5126]
MLGEYPIEGRRAVEIAASVERSVASGGLAAGELLPPMRDLAARLGVNPNTVAAAYRTLRERGVIETAGRRGSRVRDRPASTSRGSLGVDVPPGARGLADGNPDTALLPPLHDALAAAARGNAEHPRLYGRSSAIDPGLARLARAGFDADGVPAGPTGVASGSLDVIERVLAAHLKPGDTVAVEDPGWGSLLDLVPALGLRPLPVGVDDAGPLTADMAHALAAGARAVVVTDRAQNPTGAAVTEARAAELRALLASRPDVLLIEDDHGHAIVDLPLHPLAGSTAHWALVRSVAKAYGPDLRLAVFTGDELTVDRVMGRQRLGPGWVSGLLQRAVVELWESAAVDVPAVAAAYGRRRDALVRALAARGVAAHGRSGMNVWVPVSDETGAVARLLHAGLVVAPGARFRIAAPQGLRITVSTLTAADIEPVADTVAAAVSPAPARSFG